MMTDKERRLISVIQALTHNTEWFNYKFDSDYGMLFVGEECSLEEMSLEELIAKLEKSHL